jgi:PAS domain S-box-containing protein
MTGGGLAGNPPGNDMLDRITDAFFALDTGLRFTYLNGRAEQLLERSRGELLGRVIWDEFPETVETAFPEGLDRAMETGEPTAFEVYHKPLDTWFEARAYPSDSGVTVSLRDVTDRKGRERDLERYETVVETVKDGVVVLDAEDRVVFVNRAVESTVGVDREAILGEHVEAIPEVASIDAESTADLGHALDMLRRGDATDRRFEIRYAGPEGDDRVAETVMVPLGDGEVAGIVRDVTERREYERIVRSLHAITPQLLSASDRLEICSVAVHAAGEVLNLRVSGIWLLDESLNRMDPVAGTAGAHEELGGLPHFPRGDGPIWDTFRTDEPSLYDDTEEADADDGTPLRSEIVVPIGDHGVLMAGETTPGALTRTDLELATILAANTEAALDRADRDRLLRRSKATLERQNERLEVVETVLSDDLQDQLAVAAQAARRAGAEDAIGPLMRARRLAGDALELAKGEFSVGPRSPVKLCDVAEAAAEVVDGVDVSVATNASFRADRDRVVRLVETLLLDARDRAGGPVEVTVGVGGPERVYVADDAAPLPVEDRAVAFDIEAADADPEAGTPGLGLAVAGEIATAHGWQMTVADDADDTESAVTDGAGEATDPTTTRFEVCGVTTLEPADSSRAEPDT